MKDYTQIAYQNVLDAFEKLEQAMQLYAAYLASYPDADTVQKELAFRILRWRVREFSREVPRVEVAWAMPSAEQVARVSRGVIDE